MKRSPVYGDLSLTPAERKGMEAYYRALHRRDWAAKRGTFEEWRTAEARLRELQSERDVRAAGRHVEHTHDDKPLACAAEWGSFLSKPVHTTPTRAGERK